MPKKQNILALHKDKAMSFMQEFCIVAGGGIAVTMGLDKATHVRPLPFGELQAFMSGTSSGLLFYGGVAILTPLFLNWSDAMAQNKSPSVETYFPTHDHKPSRLVGIAAGALLSLTVAMNTASVTNPTSRLNLSEIADQALFSANVSAYKLQSQAEGVLGQFIPQAG